MGVFSGAWKHPLGTLFFRSFSADPQGVRDFRLTAPKPSKNAPNNYITHNMAQMGMVVRAPKAKNDRIIDLFLVLDPKPYPGGYGPYPKIWDQDTAV